MKSFALPLIPALVLALGACGKKDEPAPQPSATPISKVVPQATNSPCGQDHCLSSFEADNAKKMEQAKKFYGPK